MSENKDSIKVNLFVKDKKSEDLNFVKEVEIALSDPMPEIVNWGSRLFIHDQGNIYIEASSVIPYTV